MELSLPGCPEYATRLIEGGIYRSHDYLEMTLEVTLQNQEGVFTWLFNAMMFHLTHHAHYLQKFQEQQTELGETGCLLYAIADYEASLLPVVYERTVDFLPQDFAVPQLELCVTSIAENLVTLLRGQS